MSGRISQCFNRLKQQQRPGLITYTMAYDPDLKTSLAILKSLPAAGADIVELGFPFSDPMADGPVIQAAGERALKAGATLPKTLKLVAEFRKDDAVTPLILMGYYNPVYRYGVERFTQDAIKAGVDGVIIVDLPPEEENEFIHHARIGNLAHIRLIAPTTGEQRLPLLLKTAQGFVYYISVTGITGSKGADSKTLAQKVQAIKQHTLLPVAVGFGIKTPEQAKAVSASAEAVVVGSALVDVICKEKKTPAKAAATFVQSLAAAIRP